MDLTYRTESGAEVTASTIYPARALSLLDTTGYHFLTDRIVFLSGLSAVRMENGTMVRIHAQADNAIYVLTYPQSLLSQEDTLTRATLLWSAPQD